MVRRPEQSGPGLQAHRPSHLGLVAPAGGAKAMDQRQQRATEQVAQQEHYPVAGATADARATAALGQGPPMHRRGHILRPWRRYAREIRDRRPQSHDHPIFGRQDETRRAWPPRSVRSRRLPHPCRGRLWDHRLSGRSGRRPSRDRLEIHRSTADRPGACRSPLRSWRTPLRYGDDATLRQRHLPLAHNTSFPDLARAV